MGRLDELVDAVILAFDSRRRTRWSATRQPLTVSDPKLRRWRDVVDEQLKTFRVSMVNRPALLERVRRRFAARGASVEFADVADELQEMARDDLWRRLVTSGVPQKAARAIAKGYSIGALLHEM